MHIHLVEQWKLELFRHKQFIKSFIVVYMCLIHKSGTCVPTPTPPAVLANVYSCNLSASVWPVNRFSYMNCRLVNRFHAFEISYAMCTPTLPRRHHLPISSGDRNVKIRLLWQGRKVILYVPIIPAERRLLSVLSLTVIAPLYRKIYINFLARSFSNSKICVL